MNLSKFLSKVIGIYLVIISVAMLTNMQQFSSNMNSLINEAPLMIVVGFFTLILGILMVVSHNIWQWSWKILVTIVGWLIFLKSIGILFYPLFMDKLTLLFTQNLTFAYTAAAIDFALGILFCYFGFRRNNT